MKYSRPKANCLNIVPNDKINPIDFFNISFGGRFFSMKKADRNLVRIHKHLAVCEKECKESDGPTSTPDYGEQDTLHLDRVYVKPKDLHIGKVARTINVKKVEYVN